MFVKSISAWSVSTHFTMKKSLHCLHVLRRSMDCSLVEGCAWVLQKYQRAPPAPGYNCCPRSLTSSAAPSSPSKTAAYVGIAMLQRAAAELENLPFKSAATTVDSPLRQLQEKRRKISKNKGGKRSPNRKRTRSVKDDSEMQTTQRRTRSFNSDNEEAIPRRQGSSANQCNKKRSSPSKIDRNKKKRRKICFDEHV